MVTKRSIQTFGLLAYFSELELIEKEIGIPTEYLFDILEFKFGQNMYDDVTKYLDNLSYTVFDMLPSVVFDKILNLLDRSTLVLFGLAYPQYIPEIIRRSCWKDIEYFIDAKMFSIGDLKSIQEYMHKYIELVKIEFLQYKIINSISSSDLIKFIKDIKIKSLRCSEVYDPIFIDVIYKNCTNLQTLEVDYANLENYHVVQIANSIKGLKAIFFASSQVLNDGLTYFISSFKSIVSFGFRLTRIKSIVIQLLLDKHALYLEKISFYVYDYLACDTIFQKLKSCKKLNEIIMYNFFGSNGFHSVFSELSGLKTINIGQDPSSYVDDHYKEFEFKKENINLKHLALRFTTLSEKSLLSISTNLKNIRKFSLTCENYEKNSLLEALKIMYNIETFNYVEKNYKSTQSILPDFVKQIPRNMLPKIKFLEISTNLNDGILVDEFKCQMSDISEEIKYVIFIDNQVFKTNYF